MKGIPGRAALCQAGLSGGAFCDGSVKGIKPVLWNKCFQKNRVCVRGGQDGDLILSNQILDSAEIGVVRTDLQAHTFLLLQNDGVVQGLSQGSGIGADKASGPKQGATEIARYDCAGVMNIFAQQYVQHGASCGAGRLPVVAAAGQLMPAADGKGCAAVTGVPVLFSYVLYEALRFFLRFYRSDSGDETGFFFYDFSRSALPCKAV